LYTLNHENSLTSHFAGVWWKVEGVMKENEKSSLPEQAASIETRADEARVEPLTPEHPLWEKLQFGPCFECSDAQCETCNCNKF
jgi:hypothetical protein